MRLLRFLVNIVLAVLLFAAGVLVLGIGYGDIAANTNEYEAPMQQGREETWLQVNGEPVHLLVAGPENGPVVVLLHGSDIEGSLTFQDNIRALGLAGVRVIALDLPGFGYSTRNQALGYLVVDQVRLVEQVIESLGLKQVTLVGFQRGCAIALDYALDHPQNVKQIALLSPLVYHSARPMPNWLASTPMVGKSLVWAGTSGPLLAPLRRAGFADPSMVTSTYLETILSTTHITGTNAFQLTWMRDIRDDTMAGINDLGDLRIPVLILLGSADTSSATEDGNRLAQVLQDVKLTTLPAAGYYVQQEAAQQVNQLLVQFSLSGVR